MALHLLDNANSMKSVRNAFKDLVSHSVGQPLEIVSCYAVMIFLMA